jgi:hypothetical protein
MFSWLPFDCSYYALDILGSNILINGRRKQITVENWVKKVGKSEGCPQIFADGRHADNADLLECKDEGSPMTQRFHCGLCINLCAFA